VLKPDPGASERLVGEALDLAGLAARAEANDAGERVPYPKTGGLLSRIGGETDLVGEVRSVSVRQL
jgi:hypothetical protein